MKRNFSFVDHATYKYVATFEANIFKHFLSILTEVLPEMELFLQFQLLNAN